MAFKLAATMVLNLQHKNMFLKIQINLMLCALINLAIQQVITSLHSLQSKQGKCSLEE